MKLKVKLFADGAGKDGMFEMSKNPLIKGFTTNPTLMKKAGIKNYSSFAKNVLSTIKDKPISFEVLSDDFMEMEKQALEIASWGNNVNVKIPITNTKAESSYKLIESLSSKKVKLNITAIFTTKQVKNILPALDKRPGGYISVFAGRIADAGIDPVPIMKEIVDILADYPNIELIWASSRELFNVVQANDIGCHIITATKDILKKLPLLGKDLIEFSLDTVKMFYNDSKDSGYTI